MLNNVKIRKILKFLHHKKKNGKKNNLDLKHSHHLNFKSINCSQLIPLHVTRYGRVNKP